MSLGDLALIVAAGLAGPLLAAGRRGFVPVVAGEILAGVILGRSGFDVIHADDATVSFLAEAGFAMLMLTVGMHIPLRDRRLRRALGRRALAAGVAAIAASFGELSDRDGVPAAVVQIGLQEHVITPALGAALTLAALTTLGFCALGTDLLRRRATPSASVPPTPLGVG
ncbi:cation:proton antiporter [Solirubrobacter ginsenosidimutans]|uniref:Cation:proton antiporter n=1 Tax=Solirubrobacter ginsenosidimutans TaxID=490573 RepID=A0A9X3N1E1_9ACTN|nr:cation:proton antiporter [Solirubrobacter ginsenosidimutans]MDA0164962.1 cation:proton antiporter [Solirubrobacter ginsenosidimutans]